MNYNYRIARTVFPMLTCLSVAGCAGFQVFDSEKDAVATAIKTKYETVDILGTLDIQRQNLAAFSAEESKVVQDNLDIQRKFALLEIVDNDTPMGKTWVDDVDPAIRDLGFADAAALRTYVQGVEARKVRDRQLSGLVDRILRSTSVDVPVCGKNPPLPDADAFTWPPNLDATTLGRAKARYKIYFDACQRLLNDTAEPDQGAILRSRTAWEKARNELKKQQQAVRNAANDVKKARADHESAVQEARDAGDKGKALRKKIKESADNIEHRLDQAAKIAPGLVASERISGLVTLLKAAASEDTDFDAGDSPDAPDHELSDAVLLVNGVTSLAGDVATLVATAKAPSVSNLLIELQHQVVLLEHAQALAALDQERVDILEAKYYAYGDEALELLRFHDALCSFGIMEAGKPHPGQACDQFTFTVTDTPGGVVYACMSAGTKVANCGLEKPWKDYFRSKPTGAAGREFYKGIAALNALFPARASQVEGDFKLVDVQHRKNLASREMALKAWNNLVAVPVDQIEAYYASGLKPAEIADLLVKALGLAAITVGVSD